MEKAPQQFIKTQNHIFTKVTKGGKRRKNNLPIQPSPKQKLHKTAYPGH